MRAVARLAPHARCHATNRPQQSRAISTRARVRSASLNKCTVAHLRTCDHLNHSQAPHHLKVTSSYSASRLCRERRTTCGVRARARAPPRSHALALARRLLVLLASVACSCRLLVSLTRVTYVCRSHAPPTPRWSQSTARNHARDCVLSHASHPMHGVTRPTGRSSHELSQLVRACAARPSTSAPSRTCALATTSTTRKHHTISRSRVPTLRRGCAANAEQRAGCVRGREHRPAVMHSP